MIGRGKCISPASRMAMLGIYLWLEFSGARDLHPRKLTSQWNTIWRCISYKIMILHCRVSFRGRKIMLCIHATQFLTAQLFLNRQLLISVMDHKWQPSVPGAHLHVHRNNCVEIIKFSTFGNLGSTPYENHGWRSGRTAQSFGGMAALWLCESSSSCTIYFEPC